MDKQLEILSIHDRYQTLNLSLPDGDFSLVVPETKEFDKARLGLSEQIAKEVSESGMY